MFSIFVFILISVLNNCIYIQGVSKKSRQFRNGSQPREAASSMKFFVNIDCLGTCDVE